MAYVSSEYLHIQVLMHGGQKRAEEEKECQEEQDKNARLEKDVSLFQKRKKIEDDVRPPVSYPFGGDRPPNIAQTLSGSSA
jgi:hypothetical protein